MGGIFGAIGVLAALKERDSTGIGQEIQSALFENNVFLVGQHMMQYAVTGQAAKPMPNRISAWAIYDVFEVLYGEKIFLAVVTDTQWQIFCEAFGFKDLFHDPQLKTNNMRVAQRSRLIPSIQERLVNTPAKEIAHLFETNGLPFAPITRPDELFDDEHLLQTGGLAPITITDGPLAGTGSAIPLLPFSMDGERLGVRQNPPRVGQHTEEVLQTLGCTALEIQELVQSGVVQIENQQ
jgi:crotonobetainyl-CoA:carnitine CoA-transferase CaiB-like acyl-CoA transferase